MLNIEQRSRVLHELAGQAVPGSIDIWPSVNKRLAHPPLAEVRHTRRWAAVIAAATGLVAIVALGLVPWWNPPESVSAESILNRAESAVSSGATAVSTYHLSMTRSTK